MITSINNIEASSGEGVMYITSINNVEASSGEGVIHMIGALSSGWLSCADAGAYPSQGEWGWHRSHSG
eukprot:3434982-Pleurochrysis_carterae.AAC.1